MTPPVRDDLVLEGTVRIAIDCMGGDHGPSVTLPAARAFLAAHPQAEVILVGRADALAAARDWSRCAIVGASEVVTMQDAIEVALRRKKDSSMRVAISQVKADAGGHVAAHACVSAGNTGALMALSKLILRMSMPGLDRPAIVASWPTVKGHTAVLDVGANVNSDADQLVEFAIMGEAFHRAVHHVEKPTIGLLNVGSEDMKGREEVRGAAEMLKSGTFDLDYRGFVEGDDIAKGTVDVVVTDGFTGNIALKTAEGTARFISGLMKESLTSSLQSKIGALIASPALKAMRRRIDPGSVNGGPLLGLNGLVVKSHGGADARGFGNAIRVALDLAESDYAAKVAANMARLDAAHAHPAEAEPIS